jgi:hypothetical protein
MHATSPASTATEVNPVPGRRLQLLVPETILPLTYEATSFDGSRIAITSDEDPTSHVQSRFDAWTYVAGRYVPHGVGHVSVVGATPDAKLLVVRSSSRMSPDDTDNANDLYLVTPTTRTLVTPGTASSPQFMHVADDGSSVVFESMEPLDPADTDNDEDLYQWRAGVPGLTYLTDGTGGHVPAFQVATDDGSHVIYRLGSSFSYYERVGVSALLRAQGGPPTFSADESRLYFTAFDALTQSDTDVALDVYWSESDGTMHLATAWSDAPISFVQESIDGSRMLVASTAQLSPDDTDASNDLYILEGDQTELVSLGTVAAGKPWANETLDQVVYATWADIDPADTNEANDLYRWDSGHPGEAELLTTAIQWSNESIVDHISSDGSRIVFETPEALLPGEDFTGWPDLYEWHDGVISNLTPETATGVDFLAASEDGRRVVFQSPESLVTEDVWQGGIYVSDADLTPPIATVTGPPSAVSGPTVDIAFGTQGDDAVWFDCQSDLGAWVPCSSPLHLAGLSDGVHTLAAKGWDAAGNASDPVSTTWTVTPAPTPSPSPTPSPPPTPAPDVTAPSGTVSIAGGATYTKTTAVTVNVAATDTGTGLSHVKLSNDGVNWNSRPYAPNQAWTLPATNGIRTIYVKWVDNVGNTSAVKTDTIVLDTVVPTTTAPRRGFVASTAISAGTIALRVPWSGSDATSGIARYELAQSTDGGVWTTVSTTLTSPTATRSLAPLHTYRFRVRAIDKAGNPGAWATGATFRISRYSEFNTAISYSGPWTTVSSPAYWGGAAKKSSSAGARASLTFSGRSIAWVARSGPDRGKAAIYVNGTKVATVDLYSATAQGQRVVWVGSWTTTASRTITIRVAGTIGRPRIDLDALVTAN